MFQTTNQVVIFTEHFFESTVKSMISESSLFQIRVGSMGAHQTRVNLHEICHSSHVNIRGSKDLLPPGILGS